MNALIDFLVNNYLWFIIISLILIFALIGYLVDTSEKFQKDKEETVDSSVLETQKMDNINEAANMNIDVQENNPPQVDTIVVPSFEEEKKEETETLEI